MIKHYRVLYISLLLFLCVSIHCADYCLHVLFDILFTNIARSGKVSLKKFIVNFLINASTKEDIRDNAIIHRLGPIPLNFSIFSIYFIWLVVGYIHIL